MLARRNTCQGAYVPGEARTRGEQLCVPVSRANICEFNRRAII